MIRRRPVAAALSAVALMAAVAGGCSKSGGSDAADQRQDPGTQPGLPDSGIDGHSKGDGHDHTEPTLVDPKTGKQGRIKETDKYSATSPPPPVFREPDIVGTSGAVPLEASTSPACVEHGQKLTVVLKSEPGMTVVAQIKWPNDQFSGLDNTRGTTGADGLHTWVVDVKPTALYGVADLMAAAIDERPGQETRSGTQANWQFVVAPAGRC